MLAGPGWNLPRLWLRSAGPCVVGLGQRPARASCCNALRPYLISTDGAVWRNATTPSCRAQSYTRTYRHRLTNRSKFQFAETPVEILELKNEDGENCRCNPALFVLAFGVARLHGF